MSKDLQAEFTSQSIFILDIISQPQDIDSPVGRD